VTAAANPARAATRAGFVAILGLPNAGKSTLLNRILGEKLAITSAKPQTTRLRLAGILTRSGMQIVFVDTPGLLDPTYALQRALAGEIARSLEGLDLLYLLRDVTLEEPLGPVESATLVAARGTPAFLVYNKADASAADVVEVALARARGDGRFSEVHAVSAATGQGVEELLQATERRLPEAEFFFDPDQLTDRSMRFLAAELVRETLYEELEQELPYATHVEVTEYRENREVPRIEATIHVERESQKGIVIGHGGEKLKRIGIRSREKIERLAGGKVFLQLLVKVRPNWRRREADLRRFGYHL
jgi:GTP-binding protein Era